MLYPPLYVEVNGEIMACNLISYFYRRLFLCQFLRHQEKFYLQLTKEEQLIKRCHFNYLWCEVLWSFFNIDGFQ